MRTLHWDDVYQTFAASAYLVKRCDPHGIELYLTSQSGKREEASKNSTLNLTKIIQYCPQEKPLGRESFEESLRKIFDQVQVTVQGILTAAQSPKWRLGKSQPPGISIYIVTDGRWYVEAEEPNARGGGVDRLFRSLMAKMTGPEVKRLGIQTSIQFIHFGSDPITKTALGYFGAELGKELKLWVNLEVFWREG